MEVNPSAPSTHGEVGESAPRAVEGTVKQLVSIAIGGIILLAGATHAQPGDKAMHGR